MKLAAGTYKFINGVYIAHVIESVDECGYVKDSRYKAFKTEVEAALATLDDKQQTSWKGY